jgi:energy-coupling factor transporter ATP-binding protein EcfA2
MIKDTSNYNSVNQSHGNGDLSAALNAYEKFMQGIISEEKPEIMKEETNINTKDALEEIKNYIFAQGFDYPAGLIENFYLSLKAKPFVILAGISGTGKTRLVKLFAEAIGAEYKLVSVRPDWSDGSDLFGHTDLNGNFIPGPICAAFETAIEEKKKNRPVFLCLDEMNLARVEYYLSDFLSVIESRKKENGNVVTESIAQYKEGIPDNLYIIGTVNMDETTFPFSKKVLDRANTIEFSYVDLMPKHRMEETFAPQKLPNGFLRTEYLVLGIDCMEEKEFVEKVCTELQALNEKLVKANAQVGFRVRDEIVFYMLNNKKAGDLLTYDQAMDNEIMQKILPRIQGSSTAIRTLLIDIFKFCMGSGSGIDADTGNVGEQMKNAAASAKYPESAKKISYMMTRFEDDGFTSYWL